MKRHLELNMSFISKFFSIEKFWILIYKKFPSFYIYNVNKRYGKNKVFKFKFKDISILFSIEDFYSRTWIYKRCDFNKIHEENVVKILAEFLKFSKCFVDIGAHIGYYTFLASKIMKSGTVFSFEMDEINYELLEKNFNLNKSKNIHIYNLAISNASGFIHYTRNSEKPNPSLSSNEIDNGENTEKSVYIKSVSLDDFFKNIDLKPDVIKIDVEGAEIQVLEGMKQLLKNNDIKIFVEVHPERLLKFGLSVSRVISFLTKRGYKVFEIKDIRKKYGGKELISINENTQFLKNTMLLAHK